MKHSIIIKNKKEQSIIAEARIEILHSLTLKSLEKKDMELAKNSILIIQKIARKNKISLKKYNWFFCKKCFFPYSAQSIKISINKNTRTLNIMCKKCGHVRRKILKK